MPELSEKPTALVDSRRPFMVKFYLANILLTTKKSTTAPRSGHLPRVTSAFVVFLDHMFYRDALAMSSPDSTSSIYTATFRHVLKLFGVRDVQRTVESNRAEFQARSASTLRRVCVIQSVSSR